MAKNFNLNFKFTKKERGNVKRIESGGKRGERGEGKTCQKSLLENHFTLE